MTEHIAAADDLSTVVISEMKDEQIHDEPLVNESEILESASELKALTIQLCKTPNDSESAARIIDLASQYMEMPQLLDPLLATLISGLTQVCLDNFPKNQFPDPVYCCIYTLSNIRGFRELLPLFPNEVHMFEPVSRAFLSATSRWEVSYVLLLWLSQLALVPFDIATANSEKRDQLLNDLIEKSVGLLNSAAKDGESASFFLSRLMLRKDMADRRKTFLETAFASFSCGKERLITGYLRCIFYMLTSYDRLWVLPYATELLSSIQVLVDSPSAHHLLYHMKVIQQVALAFLPPRVAAWRYQRGSRILKIGAAVEKGDDKTDAAEDEQYKNEEDIEVPLEVNEILAALFAGLGSPRSIVRWSAAKGVARVVERLPFELASQAVEYAFALFDDKDNYNMINGACLCLAEFTLRGCLLPSTVIRAMPLILSSLVYDTELGSHTVAEGVRDSGCFVCWAIARSYDGAHLESVCDEIAQQLVNVFLFDRSVNIRRSASAAFQENVGRHGRFAHGLELIHVADFLSVSSRRGCYTKIAPFIAQFPEYGPSIVEHLANNRIKHWDTEIRSLAAESLSIIAGSHPELITNDILDSICASCSSFDIDIKHGGFEALGSLLWVMDIDSERLKGLLVLPDSCYSDEIRCAFVKMLSAAAKRGIDLPHLPKVLCDWLMSDSPLVQNSAIQSLIFLCKDEGEILKSDFFDDLLTKIAEPGVAAAISTFPVWYIKGHADQIVASIKNLLENGGPIIATKSSLLESIRRIAPFCGDENVITLLDIGLNDRTTTKRGDEGASVRTTALKVLRSMLPNGAMAKALLSDVLKLCIDRISGIRDLALIVLTKMVETTEDLPNRDKLLFVQGPNPSDFNNFANLMSVEEYGMFVCEKLILCVGAYAPDLSQKSGNSIVHFMEESDENAERGAHLICELFKKLRTDGPFTSALFAFVPRIVNPSILKGQLLQTFATAFLETSTLFLKKVYYRRLMAASQTIAGLTVMCSGELKKKAFSLLAPFFVCEFPVVRDKAAVDLTNAFEDHNFCESDDEPEDELDDDEIQAILSDTNWKEDFDACAAGVTKLCGIFGVDVPPIEKKEAAPQKRTFNYGNLVRDALG